ncbi:MAG: YfhO family protein [Acidobacteriota bacterium]|nr:YfhO family protein [Acidobacteriota bacterium]
MAAAFGWGLWQWRPALLAVPFLDDNSVHEQMVRFAAGRLAAGHSPYTSWFPYLGLGSPQFLHYQGLGATLAGAVGTGVGGDTAFRWALYLLLAGWPLVVYLSARLCSLGRPAAAAAAVMAPLLASATGVGYEPKAYVWIGWGVWTQLCASWALPLAWACTWRALSSRRALVPAVVFTALTVALHFETGYLAIGGVAVIGLFGPGRPAARLRRAALVLGGTFLAAAWVILPLLVSAPWAARNQVLAGTPLENGYGARQVLTWLVTGRLYDAGRLPVVTVLVGVGVVAAVVRWRRHAAGRVLLALWALGLVLSFGRTTFGRLTDLVPGGGDVFFRRFGMAADLSGLLLAGLGAVVVARGVATWARRAWPRLGTGPWRTPAAAGSVALVAMVALVPLLAQMDAYAGQNRRAVSDQRAYRLEVAEMGRLVGYVRAHGGGRVYAGMPSNWGATFGVGQVPVFKYLESLDVDEVGYTLRTASLMTDPEFYFDEHNVGDYALFGIRYLVLPSWEPDPVAATPVLVAGPYRLLVLPADGYVRVVDTVGVLSADRTDVGRRSVPYLRSTGPGQGRYLTVEWAGTPAARPSAPGGVPAGPAGRVAAVHDELADGSVTATVVAQRAAVVVLSASYDPGWVATVDGRQVATEMLAPALVGVAVGPGRHTVGFAYRGYGGYPWLWALAALTILALVVVGRREAPRRRGAPTAMDDPSS